MKNYLEKHFLEFQKQIIEQLTILANDNAKYDEWERKDNLTGYGKTVVLKDGFIEKGGVNFSYIRGNSLPKASSHAKDNFGSPFMAIGVSVVIHPRNPYVPTSHLNVRFISTEKKDKGNISWFGGGYDLTPFIPFEEDAKLWHSNAKKCCNKINPNFYSKFKKECDNYFFLPHRNEPRGIGGLFFDNFNELGERLSIKFLKEIISSYLCSYSKIVKIRKDISYSQEERDFQLYRRGRYVEFNLIYDRGTLFGLESNGRIESILISMPPLVAWEYRHSSKREQDLIKFFNKHANS